MITDRQLEANRRNAAKSHGPITPEGRAAVRLNALKHGLTAAEIILPTAEDKTEFELFRAAFEEECQPVGPIEQVLVEDIIANRWRMNRVRKMEPGFFALQMKFLGRRIKEDHSDLDAHAHLALIFLDDAQDADALGKMSRYEARFERSFHKALKELQRLQALRASVSDSGNGTVSQSPVSPDPETPRPASLGGADGLAVCRNPNPPHPNPVAPSDAAGIEPPVPVDVGDAA